MYISLAHVCVSACASALRWVAPQPTLPRSVEDLQVNVGHPNLFLIPKALHYELCSGSEGSEISNWVILTCHSFVNVVLCNLCVAMGRYL